MSEERETRTAAAIRRSRWPGWIWAVPIAALIIVGWLALRHFINSGPEVTVTFVHAGGVRAGETKVRYRDMDVGEVEDVRLAKDLSHVVMTLRLRSDVEKALTTGTRFWIVGAGFDMHNLGALKTIVSGPYIQMDPGPGKPARQFAGLERAAPVPADTPGTRFVLQAHELGSLGEGSEVKYLGLTVGEIESERLVDDGHGFDIAVFIRAPFDKLVHDGTRFWNAGAVRISTAAGLSAQLVSLPAIVSGAVAFETLPGAESGAPARAGQRFQLYDSEQDASGAPIGQTIPYTVRFDGAVGDLRPGAAVTLRGFRVGEVTGIGFAYDARRDRLEAPVTIALEPARLKLEGVAAPADGDWSGPMNEAIGRLIRQGLRARLDRQPPIIGAESVSLDFVAHGPPAQLVLGAEHPEIPATGSGDIAGLANRAGAILDKLDAIPFAAIGDNARRASEELRRLVANPQLAQSLDRLDRALDDVDRTAREVGGRAGPLLDSLNRAAEQAQRAAASANTLLGGVEAGQDRNLPHALHELADAARSIRSLADYLDRHPEALIKGRSGSSQ